MATASIRRQWAAEPTSLRSALAPPARAYSTEVTTWAGQGAEADIEEVDFDAALANSVKLIGTTGRDLELRTFERGQVGSVSLAVEYKKGETQWHTVEVYGPLAERAADSVRKGTRVLVEGRLKVDNWIDKGSGSKRTMVKVVASSIKKIKRWSDAQPGQSGYQQQQQQWPQEGEGYPQGEPAAGFQQEQPRYGGGQQRYGGNQQAQQAAEQQSQEELWMHLFQHPGQWTDFRSEKEQGRRSPKFPDFKKKEGGEALWITSRGTPAWVRAELPNLGS